MDPERNQEGKPSGTADDSAAVAPVSGSAATREPSSSDSPNVEAPAPQPSKKSRTRPKAGTHPNNVKKLRQSAMMSKAELARRAGVSPLTIDRVEAGCPCRMDTKRKILEALGLQPAAAKEVFPEIDLG